MLSTVWTTQRCSRSYIEKKRGRKEREVARRIKGGIKRRETDLASNQFPKCSPQPGIPKEIQSCLRKTRGREKIEVMLGRKNRVKRGKGQSSQ